MKARNDKRIVVVGGTSALAQHTLRAWLAEGNAAVHLIGRSEPGLAAVEADLTERFPGSAVSYEGADLTDIDSITRIVSRVVAEGPPDIVLIAHGSLASQAESSGDLHAMFDQLIVTGVSPVLWLEAFADRMTHGTVAIIGSVAGDRGRRSNYLYGAAKGLIEKVTQGLQNRFAGTDLHVVLIKPGPTRTPMTQHLADAGARLADVRAVGAIIALSVKNNKRVAYAPRRWGMIMAIVRNIPAPLFNRLDL
jgi:decaprenylphospho-beta-D-erythro-pentofuranosid-2-ulose 2-reductase